MELLPLLHLLSDGAFHSGDELGRRLGISRAAIWKAVGKIRAQGLEVHSVQGKGYRLPHPLELLNQEKILGHIPRTVQQRLHRLEIFPLVDSTNSLAMAKLADRGLCPPPGKSYLCLAEQQEAGRGRRGRSWVSPFGRNLYLSALRQFETGIGGIEGVSLVIALVLIRALEEYGVEGLEVKWPNDVLWQGRKLAGILIEMAGDVTGVCHLVIGIGLNIHADRESMRQVEQAWVDLYSILSRPPQRNQVVGLVVKHLLGVLEEFEARGFGHFKQEWESVHAFQDKEVELSNMGSGEGVKIRGVVKGVNRQGALCLETAGGLEYFNGGELSLRPMD